MIKGTITDHKEQGDKDILLLSDDGNEFWLVYDRSKGFHPRSVHIGASIEEEFTAKRAGKNAGKPIYDVVSAPTKSTISLVTQSGECKNMEQGSDEYFDAYYEIIDGNLCSVIEGLPELEGMSTPKKIAKLVRLEARCLSLGEWLRDQTHKCIDELLK